MAIVKSRAITGRSPLYLPEDAGGEWSVIDFDFPTAAPIAGDLWEIADLPIGCDCIDWQVVFPDVDSNGAPAFAYSLGIENAGATDLGSEVWKTGLTAGQATTIARNDNSVCAFGDNTVIRRLTMKITTAPATWAGATKVGKIALLLQA